MSRTVDTTREIATAEEYLPDSQKVVDLMKPEAMTSTELLELFRRRGLSRLVSCDDPLWRLVDLYYEHLMPMPARPCEDSADEPTVFRSPVEVRTPKANDSQVVNAKKRKGDVRLEDLVITVDPKRSNPGYGSPPASTQKVLSIRTPDSHLRDTTFNSLINVSKQYNSTSTQDGAVISRKRVKLRRDFTSLS